MYKGVSRFQQSGSRRAAFFKGKATPVGGFEKNLTQPPKILTKALSSQEMIVGIVKDYNKAGFIVKIEDILGFFPYSLMYLRTPYDYQKKDLIGQKFLFIAKEGKKKSIILSRRVALQKQLIPKMIAARDNRSILIGIITRVEKDWAFVDLGGVEGFLHISEVSGQWIEDLSKILSVGSSIKVIVLDVDADKSRITLAGTFVSRV